MYDLLNTVHVFWGNQYEDFVSLYQGSPRTTNTRKLMSTLRRLALPSVNLTCVFRGSARSCWADTPVTVTASPTKMALGHRTVHRFCCVEYRTSDFRPGVAFRMCVSFLFLNRFGRPCLVIRFAKRIPTTFINGVLGGELRISVDELAD